MKTQIVKLLTVIVLVFPLLASGQSPADALFDKYSGQEGITSVMISKNMFSLFADIESEAGDAGFSDMIKKLTGIKILTVDAEAMGKVNLHKEILKDPGMKKFEELMVVKKKDQDVTFMVRKNGEKISELLMLTEGTKDNAMISIQGDIDLRSISKLSRNMNIGGLENLNEIK